MKIGIDIDDVLAEFARGYLEKYKEKYGKEVKFEDIFSFDLWKPLGISKQESIELADSYYDSPEFDNIDLVEGAFEIIKKLNKEHKLFFITSRPLKIKDKTNLFLNKYFSDINFELVFSNDFFGSQRKSKSEICRELGIGLLIEDNKSYSLDCAKKGIKVFLFDKPWNKNFEHENVERVYSWNEILERLKVERLKDEY